MADSKSGAFPDFSELCSQARQLEKNQLKAPPAKISGSLQAEDSLSIYPKEMEDYTYAYLLSEATKVERKVFAQKYSADIQLPSLPGKPSPAGRQAPPSDRVSQELHRFASSPALPQAPGLRPPQGAALQPPPSRVPDMPLPQGISPASQPSKPQLPQLPKIIPPFSPSGKADKQGASSPTLPPLPSIMGKKAAAQPATREGKAAPPPIPASAPAPPAPPQDDIPAPEPSPEKKEDDDFVPLEVQEFESGEGGVPAAEKRGARSLGGASEFEEEGDGLPSLEEAAESKFEILSPGEKAEAADEGGERADSAEEEMAPASQSGQKKRQLPPLPSIPSKIPAAQSAPKPGLPDSAASKLSPRLRAIIEEKMRKDEMKQKEEGGAEGLEVQTEETASAEPAPIVLSARERLLAKLQAARQSLPEQAREISEAPEKGQGGASRENEGEAGQEKEEMEISVHDSKEGLEESEGRKGQSSAAGRSPQPASAPQQEAQESGLSVQQIPQPAAGSILIKPIFSGEGAGALAQQPASKPASDEDERMRRIQRIMEELSPDKYKAEAISPAAAREGLPSAKAGKAPRAKPLPAQETPAPGEERAESSRSVAAKKKPYKEKQVPMPAQPQEEQHEDSLSGAEAQEEDAGSGSPPANPPSASIQKKTKGRAKAAKEIPDASQKPPGKPARQAPAAQQPAASNKKKSAQPSNSQGGRPDDAKESSISTRPAFPQLAKAVQPPAPQAASRMPAKQPQSRTPAGKAAMLPEAMQPASSPKQQATPARKPPENEEAQSGPREYGQAGQQQKARLPSKAQPIPRSAPPISGQEHESGEASDGGSEQHEPEEARQAAIPRLMPRFPARQTPVEPEPIQEETEATLPKAEASPENIPSQKKFPPTLMRTSQGAQAGRVLPTRQMPGAQAAAPPQQGRVLPGAISRPAQPQQAPARTYVPPMRARPQPQEPEGEAPPESSPSKIPVLPIRRLVAKPLATVPPAAQPEAEPEPPQVEIARQIEKAVPKKAVLDEPVVQEKMPEEIEEEKRRAQNAAKLALLSQPASASSEKQVPAPVPPPLQSKPKAPPKTRDVAGEASLPEEEEEPLLAPPPPAEQEEDIPTPQPEQYEAAKEEFKGKMAIEEKKEEIREYAKAETDEMVEAYAKENLTWLYEIYKMGGMSREDFLQKVRDKIAEDKGGSPPAPSQSASNPAFGSVSKELEKRPK